MDRSLRFEHLAPGARADAEGTPAGGGKQLRYESGEVGCRRVQAECRVRLPRMLFVARVATAVVALRGLGLEGVLPNVVALGHPERCQDLLPHLLRQGVPGDTLHDTLQVDVTLTGITKTLPRREAQRQRLTVGAPIRQPGGVAEYPSRCDQWKPWLVRDVGFRQ